ncbi:MAG: glycerophosphoryl diester phosphodiesterase membrane domain-containing protein [Oscillospiraceae bacterium]|nr:glycerophosphoryl diester phosphodiesterase membrane domain-containing protein [Oscillospiraceae bacterium]
MGFRRSVKDILRFEALWKLAILGLINPLFREIYQTYVASVGVSFNQGMLRTFLNLKGGLLFLLLFFGAAALVFYEHCVVIHIAALCRRREDFTLGQVMRRSLWDLGALRGWSLAAGSLYYVLLLPLVRVGYVSTMVPQVTIPEFIFGEMRKSIPGVLGMLAIYAAYYAAYLLLLFTPVCMALGRRRFIPAVRENLRCWKKAGWKSRLAILAILIAWERITTEIARYWRRTPLGNADFDGNFLKYLVYSEAFRKDLLYWFLLALLQTVGMAAFLYYIVSIADRAGAGRSSLRANWSRDAGTLLEIADRRCAALAAGWRRRFRTKRWRAAGAAVCLLLAARLALTCYLPPLVHRPLAIGHRGSYFTVENTFVAILAAADMGADYAEIDVQLTRDGVPVIFHDGDLRRMAGRGESIGELDWAELREIPVADLHFPEADARIASLEEILAALADHPSGMGLLIELKPELWRGEELASAIMELVERYGFGERAMFMSLDYPCLVPIMDRHPEWWVGYCAFSTAGDIDGSVWRYGVDFLAVEELLVTNRLVTQAREQELPVYVWSVYDDEKMLQYLEMGVSGIISDYPDSAARVVAGFRQSHPDLQYQSGR